MIAWILHDEETLEKQWGCGNIYMDEDADEELAEEQLLRTPRRVRARRRRRGFWGWLTENAIFPFVAMTFVVILMGMVVPMAFDRAQLETAEAQENPGTADELTEFIQSPSEILGLVLPLIMIMVIFITLTKSFR